MSGREAILTKIRSSLNVTATDKTRQETVDTRIVTAPKGIIPARGQLEPTARTALFREMAEKVSCSVRTIETKDSVPQAVLEYLRERNLPPQVRMGDDSYLGEMPWKKHQTLETRIGPSLGDDEVCIGHALGAVAETGSVMMISGKDNPTTLNFLPEHHIVVVEAGDIAGDLEALYTKLRHKFSPRIMPRMVNLITGPSRSGDVEQNIVLGAHGPRAMHIIIVDG